MPLANGTRIGPYEINGFIGAGGMGLKRIVAHCLEKTQAEVEFNAGKQRRYARGIERCFAPLAARLKDGLRRIGR